LIGTELVESGEERAVVDGVGVEAERGRELKREPNDSDERTEDEEKEEKFL
jgi:hypothetical protein